MNSRINFYETYYKNVSPTTFEVKRSGDKIIIEGFDKKYPKNFKPKDVKQYPVNQEEFKKGGSTKSWKNKYNKKYGYPANESHSIKEISKDTGVSVKGLNKIYKKGVGARKTNPQSVRSVSDGKKRGGKSLKGKMGAQQWAMARIYSAVMGGKAAKVDAKELKMKDGGGVGGMFPDLTKNERDDIMHAYLGNKFENGGSTDSKMYRVEVYFNTAYNRPRLDFYGFKNKYSTKKDKVHLGYSDSELYINDLKMLNLYNFKLFDEYNNEEILTRLVDLIKRDMHYHTGKTKLMIRNTTY
jgi:hypothetical protein